MKKLIVFGSAFFLLVVSSCTKYTGTCRAVTGSLIDIKSLGPYHYVTLTSYECDSAGLVNAWSRLDTGVLLGANTITIENGTITKAE